jgi:hypothetical protein
MRRGLQKEQQGEGKRKGERKISYCRCTTERRQREAQRYRLWKEEAGGEKEVGVKEEDWGRGVTLKGNHMQRNRT